jgi:hydroxymethylpyrimidine pyrophosphatase-like HAD family hydrolase
MAIGDSLNDISMLQYAGLSVAMANAIDEVKAIADVTTDSNDADGVANALKKYCLS